MVGMPRRSRSEKHCNVWRCQKPISLLLCCCVYLCPLITLVLVSRLQFGLRPSGVTAPVAGPSKAPQPEVLQIAASCAEPAREADPMEEGNAQTTQQVCPLVLLGYLTSPCGPFDKACSSCK